MAVLELTSDTHLGLILLQRRVLRLLPRFARDAEERAGRHPQQAFHLVVASKLVPTMKREPLNLCNLV
jgi:hypothetical protein